MTEHEHEWAVGVKGRVAPYAFCCEPECGAELDWRELLRRLNACEKLDPEDMELEIENLENRGVRFWADFAAKLRAYANAREGK
jgi:hypothetical protein